MPDSTRTSVSPIRLTPADGPLGQPQDDSPDDGGTLPHVDSILIQASTGQAHRLVHLDPSRTGLMPIGVDKGWQLVLPTKTFRAERRLGMWPDYERHAHDDAVVKFHKGSPLAQEHGDEMHTRFMDAFADSARLLTREGRAQALKELNACEAASGAKKTSKTTYYKTLRRWLEGGLTPMALAARWRNSKPALSLLDLDEIDLAQAKAQVRVKSKRIQDEGRPKAANTRSTRDGEVRKRHVSLDPTAYEVDRATLRVFLEYYKRKGTPSKSKSLVRKGRSGVSLSDLYVQMHEEVFSTERPGFPSQKWPSWSIPSERTFKAYWTKLKSPKQREQAKSGDHNFNLTSRAKLGKSVSAAYAAGRVGELDATIWPIELVGEGPGAPIIGPAIVFRIRCKDTGQLLGLSISLENASWNGAAQAIACCLEDKREYCRRIGIDLDALGVPWDVIGLPAQIDADQGETYNTKPTRFVRLTGVHIVNMPGGRGDLKPGVEGDWNTLQVRLCNKTPGALIKQFEDEHGIKWHMKAAMTICDFMQMLVMEELKYMHRTRKYIKLTARMIEDGLNTSPHAMFKWSERKGGGGLRRHERIPVLLSLLSVETASVTEFGLTFRGVHYACNTLQVAQAYDDARMRGRWKVSVAYDPLNAGRIWLIRGDKDAPTEYVEATISLNFPNQVSYVDKTWHEVQSLMQATGVADHEHRAVTDDAFREIDRRQAELAEKSKQRVMEQRALFPTSEAALIAGRKEARTEEKYRTSPATAVSNQIPPAAAPTTPPSAPLQGPTTSVRPIAEVFKFPGPAARPGGLHAPPAGPEQVPQLSASPSASNVPGSQEAGLAATARNRKASRFASLAASLGMGRQTTPLPPDIEHD